MFLYDSSLRFLSQDCGLLSLGNKIVLTVVLAKKLQNQIFKELVATDSIVCCYVSIITPFRIIVNCFLCLLAKLPFPSNLTFLTHVCIVALWAIVVNRSKCCIFATWSMGSDLNRRITGFAIRAIEPLWYPYINWSPWRESNPHLLFRRE